MKELHFLRRVPRTAQLEKATGGGTVDPPVGASLVASCISRDDIRDTLEASKGLPLERAVYFAVSGALQKAVYSHKAEGHYALGVESYCHFHLAGFALRRSDPCTASSTRC